MNTETDSNVVAKPVGRLGPLWFGSGVLTGVVLTGLVAWQFAPGMVVVTKKSTLGFGETVAALETAIADEGWASPGTIDMNKSLAKHGENLAPRVKVIQLCKAEYARDVLLTDRYVSSFMPCAIAVWEADDDTVYVSKMNTGLVGKMFGGNIARVMGEKVAAEEQRILAAVTAH